MRRGKIGFWYRFAVLIVKPLLTVFTRRDWRGRDNVPPSGGVIVAANHLSYVDPFVIAHFLYDSGRLPRFLAKIELFHVRFVRRVLTGAKQIPVYRFTEAAAGALDPAVDALRAGECVLIYPEGTVTKEPDFWPMRAKTGVARLALATGVPVVPVTQWGAQQLYGRDKKLHLRRADVHVVAGPPVDLSDLHGTDAHTLRVATDRIMTAIRDQLAELRGQVPPAEFFEPPPRTAKVLPPTRQRRPA